MNRNGVPIRRTHTAKIDCQTEVFVQICLLFVNFSFIWERSSRFFLIFAVAYDSEQTYCIGSEIAFVLIDAKRSTKLKRSIRMKDRTLPLWVYNITWYLYAQVRPFVPYSCYKGSFGRRLTPKDKRIA